MQKVINSHCHIYPNKIAARAVSVNPQSGCGERGKTHYKAKSATTKCEGFKCRAYDYKSRKQERNIEGSRFNWYKRGIPVWR